MSVERIMKVLGQSNSKEIKKITVNELSGVVESIDPVNHLVSVKVADFIYPNLPYQMTFNPKIGDKVFVIIKDNVRYVSPATGQTYDLGSGTGVGLTRVEVETIASDKASLAVSNFKANELSAIIETAINGDLTTFKNGEMLTTIDGKITFFQDNTLNGIIDGRIDAKLTNFKNTDLQLTIESKINSMVPNKLWELFGNYVANGGAHFDALLSTYDSVNKLFNIKQGRCNIGGSDHFFGVDQVYNVDLALLADGSYYLILRSDNLFNVVASINLSTTDLTLLKIDKTGTNYVYTDVRKTTKL